MTEPPWQRRVDERMTVLRNLKHGWDSYGGIPPTRVALDMTAGLLSVMSMMAVAYPLPCPLISASADGGVLLEWFTGLGGPRASIAIDADGFLHGEALDVSGHEWSTDET